MKKIIITLIVLALIVLLVVSMTNRNDGAVVVPQGEVPTAGTSSEPVGAGERAVRGTVVSVNTDQVPVDGPALVVIRTEEGARAVIAIRSMGINFCAAQANIADVYKIKAGDRVEARGQVGVEGMILPCESAAHYLRVVVQ